MIIAIGALLIVVTLIVRNRKRKRQMQKQITSINNKHAEEIVESIKTHINVNDLNNTLHWKNYTSMKSDADLYMGGYGKQTGSTFAQRNGDTFVCVNHIGFFVKAHC